MLEGKEADRRDDIYSFACVIYEMLCGERPFGTLTALEAREAVARFRRLRGDLAVTECKALTQALALDRAAQDGTVEGALLAALSANVRLGVRPGTLLAAAILIAIAAVGLTFFALEKLWVPRQTQTIVSSEGAVVPDTIPQKSIAVLPFVNMSSDKEQEYFSDGLTEEMINLLGQVPDLRVPARTSSFYFKGKNETIANIARQLRVAQVLEGSVRKAGKRLRITAQLIRADNGYHVWSQAYDRVDTDVFVVQDDIAKAVVNALQLKLGAGVPDTGSRATTNTEAYSQYLRGRHLDQRDSLKGCAAPLRRTVGQLRSIPTTPQRMSGWRSRRRCWPTSPVTEAGSNARSAM